MYIYIQETGWTLNRLVWIWSEQVLSFWLQQPFPPCPESWQRKIPLDHGRSAHVFLHPPSVLMFRLWHITKDHISKSTSQNSSTQFMLCIIEIGLKTHFWWHVPWRFLVPRKITHLFPASCNGRFPHGWRSGCLVNTRRGNEGLGEVRLLRRWWQRDRFLVCFYF